MLRKISILLSIFLCVVSVKTQGKSDREKSGLIGYVKSVASETAEIIFKNGKPIEKSRELDSIETFDISGKQITYYAYTNNREVLYGDTKIYDSQGRLIEKRTEHSKFTNLCDKKTYVYETNGKLLEELCHLIDKGIVGKTVYRYDLSGNLFEAERIPIKEAQGYFNKNSLKRYKYDEKGNLSEVSEFERVNDEWKSVNSGFGEHNRLFFSNSQSRVSTQLTFDKDNKLLITEISLDDEKGNEIETIQYLADGSIKGGNRYKYQFDKQGNIVKEIDFEWTNENGKSFFHPSEVTYYKIEYFSENEVKEFKTNKHPTKPKRKVKNFG